MELRDTPSLVLTLITIAILLGVGMVILQNFRDSSTLVTTESVGNTTQLTGVTTAGVSVGYGRVDNSTFRAYNLTGTYTLQPGLDYHLDPVAGTIKLTAAGVLAIRGGNMNMSYSYTGLSDAYRGINQTITGINEFPNWMSIIVVVLAASLIIGLMVRSFGGGGTPSV